MITSVSVQSVGGTSMLTKELFGEAFVSGSWYYKKIVLLQINPEEPLVKQLS